MSVKIIIDSASDITPEEAKEQGFIHIPMKVNFDGVEYLDAVELTHEQFYEKLIESDSLPKTSQITPAEFADNIDKALKEADEVLIITMSSALSGTYQSACIAADDYNGQVYVVDSINVSLGERLLVERAVQLLDEGMPLKEVVDVLDEEKGSIRLIAVLDTLEYLKKGGRISPAVAFAGEVLAIKPVVEVANGTVDLIGKARGSKNANNFLRKRLDESNGIDFDRPYCVAYSGLSDHMLQKYLKDSADIWENETKEVPIHFVGSIIGTHAGPNAVGVSFFEK